METARATTGDDLALKEVELHSPVPHPGKVLAVALNYRDHLEEVQAAMPDFPHRKRRCYSPNKTSVTGPFARFICRPNPNSLIMRLSWQS